MMKRICSTLSLVTVFAASSALASDPVTSIPQVGDHYRVLTVEKSINRQNVLSAYTKLDEDCHLVTDRANRNSPLLDFYWLNNRSTYEALDSSIGSLIKGRLQVAPNGNRDKMAILISDLKTLKHDLPDPRVIISAHRGIRPGKCEIEARLKMGPSDSSSTVEVKSIYLEMGMMGGVNAVTIIGKTELSGRTINRRFAAAGY
jgi:hypothetical protein